MLALEATSAYVTDDENLLVVFLHHLVTVAMFLAIDARWRVQVEHASGGRRRKVLLWTATGEAVVAGRRGHLERSRLEGRTRWRSTLRLTQVMESTLR